MSRTVRPLITSRSENWLRRLINNHPESLSEPISQAFGWPSEEVVTWLSPLRDDEHAEYRDQCFLDRLGVEPGEVALHRFWPQGGPRWDGLGQTKSGRPLLVEAKAYVEEAYTSPSQAKGSSRDMIHRSLNATKVYVGSSSPHDWSSLFYQHANRLAHLYYLRELNHIDAYLIFIYFVDAPDVPLTTSQQEWQGANRLQRRVLGLPRRHRLSPYIAEIFVDAKLLAAV